MASSTIAIDGPSASGKSTIAKRVAQALGYCYVDSGSLYRGITWKALAAGVDTGDDSALSAMMDSMDISFFAANGAVGFRIDGVEPGTQLRSAEVDRHVSPVAAAPGVRSRIVAWLRGMTRFGELVIEGRDIGTVVFPDAVRKFYLDASPEERARRRHAELADKDRVASAMEVRDSLNRRDRIDSTRKTDPLKIADDAVVVDSTAMTVDAVTTFILRNVGGARE